MKTGRSDLDAMVKVSSIPADEPTFLLRAQDDEAANTVRDWCERQLARGVDKAIVEQGYRQADAMDKWPVKKLPGANHLTEAERLQLGYAFDRRQWNLDCAADPAAYAAALVEQARERLNHAAQVLATVDGDAEAVDAATDAQDAIHQALRDLDGRA